MFRIFQYLKDKIKVQKHFYSNYLINTFAPEKLIISAKI